MKKVIVLTIILGCCTKGFSQADTSKVEQYCEVVASGRMFSTKVTIDVDYGDERSIWKDNRLKNESGKLKKFNTVIDALNQMAKDGWQLVNAFPVSSSTNAPPVYHYVFKKLFLRSETE